MNCFGFSHSPEVEKSLDVVHVEFDKVNTQSDEFATLVFAPDPDTGNPSSALGMYLRTESPEVRELIKQHFMIDAGTGNAGVDDPDVAMYCVKGREERNADYVERLRKFAELNSKVDVND